MKAIVPLDPAALDGESVTLDEEAFRVIADRGDVVFLHFLDPVPSVTWFEDLYCERQDDPNVIKVIRLVEEEDLRAYRVPIWIQNEETPECCGKPMFFVGQIDDSDLCMEAPPDAELWWHDVASFYVFTCPYCCDVKAVGQQY